MVLNVHKTIRLIRDGERVEGVWGVVGRGVKGGDHVPIATLSPSE